MRVLVVDDDPIMRDIVGEFLSQQGYDVTIAWDGKEALDLFNSEPYPLVISDWVMPEMDGLQLTQSIRAMELNTYSYIILLTGQEGHANKIAAMDSGVDAFLSKPFNASELEMQLKVAGRILTYLAHIRRLESLMPVCCCCKKIRDEKKEWQGLDEYINQHAETVLTYALCPECLKDRVNPAMIPPGMRPT